MNSEEIKREISNLESELEGLKKDLKNEVDATQKKFLRGLIDNNIGLTNAWKRKLKNGN